jgi:hypothetical protein
LNVRGDFVLEQKRNFLIERLTARGITTTQNGTNIYEAEYKELLYELTLDAFREVDVANEENKWF